MFVIDNNNFLIKYIDDYHILFNWKTFKRQI